jgi:signal peptidase I
MSHSDPAAYSNLPLEQITSTLPERGQVLLAAFISPLLPGIGHFLLKRRSKGVLLLLMFLTLLAGVCPLRLEAKPGMLISLGFALIALSIYTTWDAGYGESHASPKITQWWLALLLPFALICATGHMNWSTRVAGFQMFEIPSESMQNGIMMGDHIIVDRRYYENNPPRDGDIAVLVNHEGLFVIKRIIALGGETIEGHDGKVLLNGKLLNEPYVLQSGPMVPEQSEFGPLTIPPGEMFVLGDNRAISIDSRSPTMGPLETTSLRGRALYTLRSSSNRAFRSLK